MKSQSLKIMAPDYDWRSKIHIMGILNLTPDSFSGDGVFAGTANLDPVLYRAEQIFDEGADILDIGGESTRPGARKISLQEEIDRLSAAIMAISERLDGLISIDTYKAKVAQLAIEAGASMVNDVMALQGDPLMADFVADAGVPVVLMHNSSDPANVQYDERLGSSYKVADHTDIISQVKSGLMQSVDYALSKGIAKERIILDPGFGFGKSVDQNIEMLRRFSEFNQLGFPLLSGTSRKSFIGHLLDLPVTQRLEGSLATADLAIKQGASIVRVHDVRETALLVRRSPSFVF